MAVSNSPNSPLNSNRSTRFQLGVYVVLLLVYWWLGFFARVHPPEWIAVPDMDKLLLIIQVASACIVLLLFLLAHSLLWHGAKSRDQSQADRPVEKLPLSVVWRQTFPYRASHSGLLVLLALGILFIALFFLPWDLYVTSESIGLFFLTWFGLFAGFSLACLCLFSMLDAMNGRILLSRVARASHRKQKAQRESSLVSSPRGTTAPAEVPLALPTIIKTGDGSTPAKILRVDRPPSPSFLRHLPPSFRHTFQVPVPFVHRSLSSPAVDSLPGEEFCLANHYAPSYRLFPVTEPAALASSNQIAPNATLTTETPSDASAGSIRASTTPAGTTPSPSPASPASIIETKPSATPASSSAPVGLIVYPEVAVFGSRIKLSFILRNRTGTSLFQIRVFPRIPEALHIYVNVPPVPQVQSGEKLEVSYEVEPSACGEFYLGGDVLYEDGTHNPQWIALPPVAFSIQCPALSPARVNMVQIRDALPRLSEAYREFLVSDLPKELLGQVATRAMASFSLTSVESIQSMDPLAPSETWFAGTETRELRRPLYVQVQVLAQPARVIVHAWGTDNEIVAGFLARLADVITTELAIVRHLQDQARDKITHAARIGELLVTLQDFCMIEWHRVDTRVKLQELANLLSLFDATTPVLGEVREWVQKLSAGATGDATSQNLTPAEREQLEAALVKWKDAIDQMLAKFSLQVKEVTPNAVPA